MVSMTIIPFMIYQFGDGLQCNYANAMRGTANVRPLIWIAFVSFFIVSLPLGYLFWSRYELSAGRCLVAFPFWFNTVRRTLLYLLSEGIEQDRVWSKDIIHNYDYYYTS